MKTLILILLACLLTACGGSTSEEPEERASTQPVNCKANPEACR